MKMRRRRWLRDRLPKLGVRTPKFKRFVIPLAQNSSDPDARRVSALVAYAPSFEEAQRSAERFLAEMASGKLKTRSG